MGKKYNFSDEEINEMVDLYENKLEAVYNIAKKFNVNESVIKSRLNKRGVIMVKGSAYSIKYWVGRGLSEEDAKNHIKTLRPVNIEYWIKRGYSEEDGILQIEGQKLVSLRGCIARFGKEAGKNKWNEREELRSINGKKGSAGLEYWINKGFSLEEAELKRSQRQTTFSKEICIKKYGETEGISVFNERQIKWNDSLNKGGNLKMGYSKISQELFYELLDNYEIKDKNNILFATHNKELRLEKDGGGMWLYDFCDTKNKKIIEYHGDVYHGNPKKYKSNDNPHPFRNGITAQEMWDKDEVKTNVANDDGYDVLVIWDSEYRWGSKSKVIERCIKFLNK